MPIVFYNMQGCGFCAKAMKMLEHEIAQGKIIVKPNTEAPAEVKGFPHFINTDNGKSQSGLPKDKESLFSILQAEGAAAPSRDALPPGALIIFYFMENCGHCTASMKLLADHIEMGHVILMPSSKAPLNTRGFPAFQSVATGKMSLGKPSSWEDLLEKLDIKVEEFHYMSEPWEMAGVL